MVLGIRRIFSIGNGAEIRPLEMDRKSPVTIPAYLTLQEHCEENTQPAHPIQMGHVNHR